MSAEFVQQSRKWVVAPIVMVLAVSAAPRETAAQNGTSSAIAGRITEASGSAVPGARVQATSTRSQWERMRRRR